MVWRNRTGGECTMNKVTWEMVDYWLGDDSVRELLVEIANGEYKTEQFKQDVIDTWQEENADDMG
tara:strand:- start:457 stop:651 length:195 start_codon:yes stop_codon:yes gene_type:complete